MGIIKFRRKQLNFTQKKLAVMCSIRQNYVSKLENNKVLPTINVLLNISYALQICPLAILREYTCINCVYKNNCIFYY